VDNLRRLAAESAHKEKLRREYGLTTGEWIAGIPALLLVLMLAFG
jgi:hypothetical protein